MSPNPKSLIKRFWGNYPPTQYPLLRNFGEPPLQPKLRDFWKTSPPTQNLLRSTVSYYTVIHIYIVLKQNSATLLKTNFQVVPASVRISGVPNAVAPNDEPRKLNAWI